MEVEELKRKYKLNADDTRYMEKVISKASKILSYSNDGIVNIELRALIDKLAKLKSDNSRLMKKNISLSKEIAELHQQKNPYLENLYKAEIADLKSKVEKLETEKGMLTGRFEKETEEELIKHINARRRKNRVFNRRICRSYGPFTYEYRKGKSPKEVMEKCYLSKSTYYRYCTLIEEVDDLRKSGKLKTSDFKHTKADYIERLFKEVSELSEEKHVSALAVWEDMYGSLSKKQKQKKQSSESRKAREQGTYDASGESREEKIQSVKIWAQYRTRY